VGEEPVEGAAAAEGLESESHAGAAARRAGVAAARVTGTLIQYNTLPLLSPESGTLAPQLFLPGQG